MRSPKMDAALRYFAVIMITGQAGFAGNIIPPFLDHLKVPVTLLGFLVSVSSISSLAARLPAGVVYHPRRARYFMAIFLVTIAIANLFYAIVSHPFLFALVQILYGFSYGVLTTMYLAFFVDGLGDVSRRHLAMGYYTACLAVGHSVGNIVSGYFADRFGFPLTFATGSVLALGTAGVILAIQGPKITLLPASNKGMAGGKEQEGRIKRGFSPLADPKIAAMALVALFLNLLLQLGNSFFPLYGLAVGLNLTQIGLVKSTFSLCNAITRPFSGGLVRRVGHRRLSSVGIVMQAAFLTLVSLFTDLAWLLVVFFIAGFFRAIVMVGNTVSVVEDVDDKRVGRGVASGILHGAGDVGSIMGPSVGGGIAAVVGVKHLFLVAPPLMASVFFLALWATRGFGKEPLPQVVDRKF